MCAAKPLSPGAISAFNVKAGISYSPHSAAETQSASHSNAPLAVPGYDMAMFWGERSHRDPAHKWLREHLLASV